MNYQVDLHTEKDKSPEYLKKMMTYMTGDFIDLR